MKTLAMLGVMCSLGLGSLGSGSVGSGSVGLGSLDLSRLGLSSLGLSGLGLKSLGLDGLGLGGPGLESLRPGGAAAADRVRATVAPVGQAPARIEPTLTDPARLTQDWELDGSGVWALRGGVLALEKPGVPAGKIRRPSALALLKAAPQGDVTFELEVRSTAPLPDKVPRRDLLLIVDYESPTRFYYVHISAARDDVHNGVFLVDNADRRRIDTQSARAPLTDEAWHRVRLERRHATGRIEVYWEDDREPFMVATDRTLKGGRVGVGSFDDSGEFRAIRVTGPTR